MDITAGPVGLKNLGSINVVLGKNGVGKSRLLRTLDTEFSKNKQANLTKYISPERGGELEFQPAVAQNIRRGDWLFTERRRNRVQQFRNMSHLQYQALETLVLRAREHNPDADSFDDIVLKINALLDHVELVRGTSTDMEFRTKETGQSQEADTLSSGESELLSLAIEILSFCFEAAHEDNNGKFKSLLVDEPDVHLHPDLQHRLMNLIVDSVEGKDITVIVASHSTALLPGLADAAGRVAFMAKSDQEIEFEPITDQLKDVIPIFGAHPLTNVFNENPILLVEGDSDVRIWQQAVRSSAGRIKVWPCAAGDIQSLNQYEQIAQKVIGSVYDQAQAFSLRDKDDDPYEIVDLQYVTRMRLQCRAGENLILSDDVLESLGTDWEQLVDRVIDWLKTETDHQQFEQMQNFAREFDRLNFDVKELRNLFMAISGSSKPWEVAVGQAIASLNERPQDDEGCLAHFLGPAAVTSLGLLVVQQ